MFYIPKKTKGKTSSSRASSQNPKILEVNLIKDEGQTFFDWNKNLLVLALVIFLAGIFVVEVYFGLTWWESQEAARLEPIRISVAEANAATAKLKNQTSDALNYKDKINDFSILLNDHIYWSNFFNWLERNTLSTVQYDSFEGGLDGSYILSATAPSYADISWQVKSFLNDSKTKKVKVLSASNLREKDSATPGQVKFEILLQVDPVIFKG
ncbi:hypothetical protein GW920_00175 [Candidatus Falkowbacteria bacterium]|uniref:Uncharacterized protein n=1 Tax=Candidatus Falkowbacteria bacterium CG10_big_fil_rev_8_21_14_0_10_37_18 TaxID=1974562 RepID=A0A2H0V9J0_9BACT|nr:hypothetical protein [Candidatus Falkowbacteria bacterium]OIO05455.1 MAG: hypothetical protein AUJ26_03200 [Candidatus Falkowbacteria bacterium CG1_02_37_21]PIR95774.1 MAG: hypothetical protein COT93_00570 [Candidatus Falkowbacteria bacterium CG10_big_fil_rev_8_21_14_0_10_37_18]